MDKTIRILSVIFRVDILTHVIGTSQKKQKRNTESYR